MRLAIVEIHDISPYYEKETYRAITLLKELEIEKFSLLIIPNFNGKFSINHYRDFVSYLQSLNQEMILHGLTHQGRIRLRDLLYTYKEGEFGALSSRETAQRLEEAIVTLGRSAIRSSLFVPPAWIGNPWLEEVLASFGFTGVAYRRIIRSLKIKKDFISPALNFSNRYLLSYLSLKAIPVLSNYFNNSSIMRLALHTKDFRDQRKIELWKNLLSSAKKERRLISYGELLRQG